MKGYTLPPIDIICRVIDHLGDVGVAWRLAVSVKRTTPDQLVRLLIDDPSILGWLIAPEEHGLIEIIPFETILPVSFTFSPIIIESLGCRIPDALRDIAYNSPRTVLHLEALSAEPWVKKVHGKESLLATSARRFMLCPGFEPGTLGMLPHLPLSMNREEFVAAHNLNLSTNTLWIAVYVYDIDLSSWLQAADRLGNKVEFIVLGTDPSTTGSSNAFGNGMTTRSVADSSTTACIHYLNNISQRSFDTLLGLCDLNLTRGEDSFATSLQLGLPMLWQAYPQDDETRHIKVEAFLGWVERSAPDIHKSWYTIMRGINGLATQPSEGIILAFLESLGTMRHGFTQLGQRIQSLGPFVKNLLSTINDLK